MQPIVRWSANAQVLTALGQADKADSFPVRLEDHEAVQIFGLALELKLLAAIDFGGLRLDRSVAAPATPQIAVTDKAKAIQCTLVCNTNQLGLVRQRDTVGTYVIAPDAAVGCALSFISSWRS